MGSKAVRRDQDKVVAAGRPNSSRSAVEREHGQHGAQATPAVGILFTAHHDRQVIVARLCARVAWWRDLQGQGSPLPGVQDQLLRLAAPARIDPPLHPPLKGRPVRAVVDDRDAEQRTLPCLHGQPAGLERRHDDVVGPIVDAQGRLTRRRRGFFGDTCDFAVHFHDLPGGERQFHLRCKFVRLRRNAPGWELSRIGGTVGRIKHGA